jgi:hypothetical protein
MKTAPHPAATRREGSVLDLIGALCLGAIIVIDAIAILAFAAMSRAAKALAFATPFAWMAALVALAATGRFDQGALVPGVPLAFAAALLVGIISWTAAPRFRRAMLSVPLLELVGVHATRVAGVLFLILLAQNRLPLYFAASAGIGDILTGLGAIGIAMRLAAGRSVSGRTLAIWNAFGALDLFVAVSLGVVSSPGLPIQLFGTPNANAITSLPWLLVPTLLVPFYLLTHLTIAARLKGASKAAGLAFAA